MSLIQKISSTLKTWVFKNKVLKFSTRFARDPQACFYCPEMCRFSCPSAETLREDTVTPRGKMSLLHFAERGFSAEQITGTEKQRQWFLDQCTGCGRCTEYCLHEIDVAENLRKERSKYLRLDRPFEVTNVERFSGKILICEPGRENWWMSRPKLLEELGVDEVVDVDLPHKEWAHGSLTETSIVRIVDSFKLCSYICIESPEVAWFFAKGVVPKSKELKMPIRTVWQKLYHRVASIDFPTEVSFHESFHLSRLLPRQGYSIPMYEKGMLPFHHGWNVYDCGGEGHFKHHHPDTAKKMAKRFLFDLKKDDRKLSKIVCQSYSCVSHLKNESAPATYWLDELRTAND